MKKGQRVLIIGGGQAYAQMFRMYGWEVAEDIHEADLLQFTGGHDVSPVLYGENTHPATSSNYQRDMREREMFLVALDLGIPCAGICRGGQFLNAMNGGKMWQHVDKHAIGGTHAATDLRTERVVQVSSTHHQMMRPANAATILCTAKESTSKECMLDGKKYLTIDMDILNWEEVDAEVVLYKGTKSLCFQPHPEFVAHSPEYKECADYFFECLEEIV